MCCCAWVGGGRVRTQWEIPSKPCVVVGNGISRPLFLHLPQQLHPVHCRPALRHSHARADVPMLEQFECRVQMQHHSTNSWARLLEQLTVELVPTSPVGVSPFLFSPPDGPSAVEYLNMPPAIARPSLLRSEIVAGIFHRDLTLLAHSRRPLAHWRPHLHRGVCVCLCLCVCVCVCVCM